MLLIMSLRRNDMRCVLTPSHSKCTKVAAGRWPR